MSAPHEPFASRTVIAADFGLAGVTGGVSRTCGILDDRHHHASMKTVYLFAIAVSMAVVASCAASHQTESRPPAASSSSSADLQVISAVYGGGINWADVTVRVNALLNRPDFEFFARPEWLHADPTPGWNKALVIVYECEGRRHIFTTGEGGRVSVEQLVELAEKDLMPPKKRGE